MDESVGPIIDRNNINEELQKKIISIKSVKFDQEWVQVLINLRMKYSKLFTRRRNSASDGWKLVFEELKASGAPDFITITKIKKKWMNLMTRFRQIKNSAQSPDKVTWPYFEQMNRAFGKEAPATDEYDRKIDNNLLNTINNDERQNFIKKLIELRHINRHLFTGRKYTARDGWLIIRSLLQCDDKYSVEQLSKCWQNLVQRFKQLSKCESNITWPYYQLMNNWHKEENNLENVKTEDTNVIESEDKSVVINERENMSENKNDASINEIVLHLNKIKEEADIVYDILKNYNFKYT